MSCFSRLTLFTFCPKKGVPSKEFGSLIPANDKTVGTKSTKSTKVDVLVPASNGFRFYHF